MSGPAIHWAILAVALSVFGCGEKAPPTNPDTGARLAAETYFGGLIAGDDPRAFATLDPVSKRRVSADQFAILTRTYVKNLGFTADTVHIQASEEQGDTATVHVALTGSLAGHSRRYIDGITLSRMEGQWRVSIPKNFGLKAR